MQSPYDQQSDMWSVGVIMYLLLGGDLPFMGRTQKELFRSIVLCEYDFPEKSWSHVSDEAKDLVKKLLVSDPAKRLTSQAAMQSPWMQQGNNLLEKNDLEYTSRRLKTFNARMKLRSSMIAVTLITSAKMSVSKKLGLANSNRSLNSEESQANEETAATTKELPSFLDLPEEKNDTYQLA